MAHQQEYDFDSEDDDYVDPNDPIFSSYYSHDIPLSDDDIDVDEPLEQEASTFPGGDGEKSGRMSPVSA